jgi:hypothetical protein
MMMMIRVNRIEQNEKIIMTYSTIYLSRLNVDKQRRNDT